MTFLRVMFVTAAAVGGSLAGFYYQDKAKRELWEDYQKHAAVMTDEELAALHARMGWPAPKPRTPAASAAPSEN
ncbi:hypothetical protein AMAG_20055 [Allomyces macrogynus ATCC 38327]|uniref:Uncharacterized protein n=1 Tax=Allomyces macrogynus (strain ATCC 38327) TaxID=578462 RepID=A0A0L0T546_ALLM3|nr:hypothetical protein AMAG_20055 [Allomyces macrogynus ATCC 38327]|eukprot:KNE69831.1 hypothetical protein AMAG_20055 [Allomyces macrogynus ATCC 38327]